MPREKKKPNRLVFEATGTQNSTAADAAPTPEGSDDDDYFLQADAQSSTKKRMSVPNDDDDDIIQEDIPPSVWSVRNVVNDPLVYAKSLSTPESDVVCIGTVGICPFEIFDDWHPQRIVLSKRGIFGFLKEVEGSDRYEIFGVLYTSKIAKEIESYWQLLFFDIRQDFSSECYQLYVYLKHASYYSFSCLVWALGIDEIINLSSKGSSEDFESIFANNNDTSMHTKKKKTEIDIECFSLQNLMSSLCEGSVSATDIYTSFDLMAASQEIKSAGITTELRNYQIRGILWMLARETETSLSADGQVSDIDNISTSSTVSLPAVTSMQHLLTALRSVTCDGWINLSQSYSSKAVTIWYNILTGMLSTDFPVPLPLITGGILGT